MRLCRRIVCGSASAEPSFNFRVLEPKSLVAIRTTFHNKKSRKCLIAGSRNASRVSAIKWVACFRTGRLSDSENRMGVGNSHCQQFFSRLFTGVRSFFGVGDDALFLFLQPICSLADERAPLSGSLSGVLPPYNIVRTASLLSSESHPGPQAALG